jgi:transposase
MRVSTVFNRLLRPQRWRVVDVEIRADALCIFLDVAFSGAMRCSRCRRRTRQGVHDRHRGRLWRHLNLMAWEVYLRFDLRRFKCLPCQRVVTEAVPWAVLESDFTRDFEDLTAYLAQKSDETAVSRMMRIAWP